MSAALARDQIAFFDEHLVCEHDGVACDAQLIGEFAARRQGYVGCELAVEDRGDEHLPDLILQALLRPRRALKLLGP